MLLISNLDQSGKIKKQLKNKANFGTFLQLNCSNFRLKHFEGA